MAKSTRKRAQDRGEAQADHRRGDLLELSLRRRAAASFGVAVEEVIDNTVEFEEVLAQVPWQESADGRKVRRTSLGGLFVEAERLSRERHPQRWGRAREAERARVHAGGDAIRPAVVRRTPAARPAARRPRTSAKRSTSRAGPDDGSDEPAPGDAGPAPDHHEGLRDSPAHRVALAWLDAGAHLLGEEQGR